VAAYDYLIAGAGLFGSVFAHEMKRRGKRCLVIEKRAHLAGNTYTEKTGGILVHRYGAHIFHTSREEIWNQVNRIIPFRPFINAPLACYGGKLYNLPFNMNTFYQLWQVTTPAAAREMIEAQKLRLNRPPQNLEEQALSLVGRDVYHQLIKGYTEKQWGRPCVDLPPDIIKRLPVRFTFDNNYFNDPFQGIPSTPGGGGYTELVEKLLSGIEVRLNEDYLDRRNYWDAQAARILFTGPIDAFYDYGFGPLEYRGLRFEDETLEEENHQGNAVINYTAAEVPYTRVIEHKHFAPGTVSPRTVITREYPAPWKAGEDAYYPVNDAKNRALYEKYADRGRGDRRLLFGGRLGLYQYLDMDKVVEKALDLAAAESGDSLETG
jgi:UDP-galactopyranose mutase